MSECWMLKHGVPKMTVVLPVCAADGKLMLENVRWQADMEPQRDFDCMLMVDDETPSGLFFDILREGQRAYRNCDYNVYPTAPVRAWPNAPNWAFQQAARYMSVLGNPWFWMEPDCVPLKRKWLERWNMEYWRIGKPMMGSIIKGMGHCNGTAVYPANFPQICPEAMQCTTVAWDGVMKEKTIKLTHDAAGLMCHVWGIGKKGIAMPAGGAPAHFTSLKDVDRWISFGAVLFHRAKDTSLIEQLRIRHQMQYESPDTHRVVLQGHSVLEAQPA